MRFPLPDMNQKMEHIRNVLGILLSVHPREIDSVFTFSKPNCLTQDKIDLPSENRKSFPSQHEPKRVIILVARSHAALRSSASRPASVIARIMPISSALSSRDERMRRTCCQ